MYSFALEMAPMKSIKCFHDFHHWKFKHASVDLELLAISTYKKNAFQQLLGGLCNGFNSSSFDLIEFSRRAF